MKLWMLGWNVAFLWFAAKAASDNGESRKFAYTLATLSSLGIVIAAMLI